MDALRNKNQDSTRPPQRERQNLPPPPPPPRDRIHPPPLFPAHDNNPLLQEAKMLPMPVRWSLRQLSAVLSASATLKPAVEQTRHKEGQILTL
jgi:hypothetical protein